jgi:hypothetical protein
VESARLARASAALGATRKKDTYLAAQYRRITTRRGAKRAQTAVAHSILVAAWHVLTTNTPYHDPGSDYFINRDNPTTDAAEPSLNSNASATTSPSNPWRLDQSRGHFRVNTERSRGGRALPRDDTPTTKTRPGLRGVGTTL